MKRTVLYILILSTLLFVTQVTANEKVVKKDKNEWRKDLKINFNFFNRTRFIGTKIDDNDFIDIFTQKTLLGVEAKLKGAGKFVFQLRNTSLLGTGYGNNYVDDNLAVYQAYGQFKLPFGVHSCLYFGRKVINIDTQYIFGAVGFHDVGKTFDTAGLTMLLIDKKLKLNIFSVRQSESDFTNLNDEFMNVLHARYQLNKTMGFSFLYINDITTVLADPADANSKDETYMGNLIGLRADGKMKFGFNYNLELYYQFGDNVVIGAANGSKGSTSAYALLLDLSYSLKNLKPKPTFGILFNLNSGDSDTTDDTNNNFFVAMGTKHKFFGYMDKYLKTENWGGQGILDTSFYIKWSCAFHKNLKFKLDYHYFMPLVKVNNADKKSLGMEIDFTANLKINNIFSFVTIFGYFIPGSLQKDATIIKDKQLFTYGAFQVKF